MDKKGMEGVIHFLNNEKGQVVVGPKNKMWIVDGHHHARALEILRKEDSRFSGVRFTAKVRNEWNELTPAEFEAAMKVGNKKSEPGEYSYVYLKDQKGRSRSFKALPKKLSSLKDFPWQIGRAHV